MKVAIITYTDSRNPGAQLQAYALKEAVKNITKSECCQIEHRKFDDKIFEPIKGINSLIKNAYSLLDYSARKRCVKRYEHFRSEYLDLTDECYSDEKKRELNECIDAFITGSDQIWNCQKGMYLPFFLDFVAENKLKIAYSASMGVVGVEEQYKSEFLHQLKRFDKISVREQQVADYLENEFGVTSVTTCDPVFLLKKEKWQGIIENSNNTIKDRYIFVFTTEMTAEFKLILKEIQKKTALKIISMRYMSGIKSKVLLDVGPLEFLKYIAGSEMVVTNSFHATAFSIIFEKDFYCALHSSRGSRLLNLLGRLSLQDRILSGETVLGFKPKSIDYKKIISLKEKYIAESILYLKSVFAEESDDR